MRPDPDARDAQDLPLIELQAEVPERHLALKMSMHREPAGSAMSQLAEFQFIRPDQQANCRESERQGSLANCLARLSPVATSRYPSITGCT